MLAGTARAVGGFLDRVDRWQRDHRSAGFIYGVIRKFGQDHAGNLAALMSYYGFFSIFPLLLAFVTILGYVTAGNKHLYNTIFDSAVGSFPILNSSSTCSGTAQHCANQSLVSNVKPLTGNPLALTIGLLLAIYAGLAVAKTAQTAFNDIYGVAQNERPNFFKGVLRAMVLVLTIGVGLIVATFVGSLASNAGTLGLDFIGPGLRVVSILLSLAILTVVFDAAFNWLTVRPMTWRDALPGAIVAAVGYEAVSQAATAFIAHKTTTSGATYGTFALVIAILSWFYLAAQIVMFAAEINCVRQFHFWPRALRNAPSTDADFRALEFYVERERYHADERLTTSFVPEKPAGPLLAAERSKGPDTSS